MVRGHRPIGATNKGSPVVKEGDNTVGIEHGYLVAEWVRISRAPIGRERREKGRAWRDGRNRDR